MSKSENSTELAPFRPLPRKENSTFKWTKRKINHDRVRKIWAENEYEGLPKDA